MEEIHNYPFDPVIKFKQQGRSFSYKIIKEGTYPNKESLVYTLPPNKYHIPNNYIVETTWGRSTNQCTVQCHINYNDGKPIFQVWFGKCFEYRVSSVKTATDASNLFHKHYTSQKELKRQKIESVVRALDEGNISRNPYRRLCAIESHLPREGVVSKERQRINKEMAQLIPILIVDINAQVDLSEDEDIEDENIAQEIIDAVGKGGHRNIKDILRYLVPDLIQKRILNLHHPVINLRISGDGRNVGRKIKHVMITMAILDDKDTLHKPNSYHTIILYPGCENYDSLSNIMVPFCHDLRNLKEQGLIINNIRWNFQFYFSSDWKFLATCLGFNGAHSKNFCPWCTISKSQQGDLSKEWSISKNINKLVEKNNYYEGHTRKPLFDMIPLDHWIPDELHIMLRITDRLWSLLIAELMEQNLFNDTARKIIIDEMKRIKINFQFWQDHGSKTWNYTSLMGNDKVK
ncbi:hypothetical protein RhiirA1_404413, partial [Rhizophagus irregularis]